MNGLALLGIFLIIYAVVLVFITLKKPESIWNMTKIRMFRNVLGEKGTEVFFYIFAVAAAVVGIWLMIR